MCVDVTPEGDYCLTCSNGFGGNGCEATVSLKQVIKSWIIDLHLYLFYYL